MYCGFSSLKYPAALDRIAQSIIMSEGQYTRALSLVEQYSKDTASVTSSKEEI